jgi:hypothetical protein
VSDATADHQPTQPGPKAETPPSFLTLFSLSNFELPSTPFATESHPAHPCYFLLAVAASSLSAPRNAQVESKRFSTMASFEGGFDKQERFGAV